jgi:HrpA-like RNA helicase
VSDYVSRVRNSSSGEEVGYKIRHEDKTTEGKTCVIYATDGVLLRELLFNPLLNGYSVVMVDEVHERTINTDILLSLLKKIQKKKLNFKNLNRKNDKLNDLNNNNNNILKLIISSASIDALLWKNFFDYSNSGFICLFIYLIIIIRYY